LTRDSEPKKSNSEPDGLSKSPFETGMQLPQPLRGIVTAMITPLTRRGTLDGPGLERLVEHLISGGVHGLFILGTTGEGPALSHKLRIEVIKETCRHVADRIPVIVGVTSTVLEEAVALAENAKELSAQAVVTSAPYYYPASQAELLNYLEKLAAVSPLPVFLYNAPANTHHTFRPSTVREAAGIPNIVGLKDSGCDMIYFHAVRESLKDRPDFTLLVGPEELMAEAVLLGGHGGMCAGSNIWPRLYVDLYNAAVECDFSTIRRLQSTVMRLSTTIYRVDASDSSLLRGMKCAVAELGICADGMTPPFQPFDGTARAKIRQYLGDLGLLETVKTRDRAAAQQEN
jgi:4-hydroxy-tetrahydrodipicolinate synthase